MANYTSPSQVTSALASAIANNPANSLALFNAIKTIHTDAKTSNVSIIYPSTNDVPGHSNGVIELTLTSSTVTPIPLSQYVDFNEWTFQVTVNSSFPTLEEPFLFFYGSSNLYPISDGINKRMIDTGCFLDVDALKTGLKILVIEDQTPWTYRCDTPDTYETQPTPWAYWNQNDPRKRKDLLLIKDGLAINRPIAPYDTMLSSPKCDYLPVSAEESVFTNIKFVRTSSCKRVLNLLHVKRVNNMHVSYVNVTTNATSPVLTNDSCLTFRDTTNIWIDDCIINGTYSTATQHGYGFQFNNVWNVHLSNVTAITPKWGVFGSNHVNTAVLRNCQLNRFDVHCYGRDVTCEGCTFQNNSYLTEVQGIPVDQKTEINAIFNRFSSLYGTLTYKNCNFDGFYMFFTDEAYNIYHGCDVRIIECTQTIYSTWHAFLFTMGFWAAPLNVRQEHIRKCWYNVSIEGLTIKLRPGISNVYMFFLKDRNSPTSPVAIKEPVYHTSFLSVKDLQIKDLNNTLNNTAKFKETNFGPTEVKYAQRVFRYVQDEFYGDPDDETVRLELTNSDF